MAGLLTFGVGLRLAMRVSGALTPIERRGRVTDAGETVGVVSLDGTLTLLALGLAAGVVGGLFCALVHTHLPVHAR